MKLLLTIIILSSITLSCKEKSDTKQKKVNTKRDNRFSNITRVIQLGDSVRIEIEDRNGTTVKHYIDLKGTSDDGFNNSYNVICTYTKRDVDSTIVFKNQKLRIKELLNEHYESEFSAGTNYFIITEKNDTVLINHILDYIR